MTAGVVVVGAGQAGLQLALSLRDGRYAGPVTLIGDEDSLPYGRPALSKAFLKGADTPDTLWLRPRSLLESRGITLRTGMQVVGIDRPLKRLMLTGGEALAYDALVLATGARNRVLPVPGTGLSGVLSLRGSADAIRLRQALAAARTIVVVGGGFLGLEVASTASATGLAKVHVVEAGPRLMGRAVSVPVSDYFLRRHVQAGSTVLLNESVTALSGIAGEVRAVQLRSGAELPADLVLVAIGVVPNTKLASAAGLEVADGIAVDAAMRTGDPAIYAIGDCALHPNRHARNPLRIESVQNAADQARCAAANIIGLPTAYTAVPWFWSDQAETRLQIAGLRGAADETEVIGGGDAFSVRNLRDGQLTCVESINRPVDHAQARKELSLLGPAQAVAA